MERFESGLSAAIERHHPRGKGAIERQGQDNSRLVAVDSLYDRLVVQADPGEPTPETVAEAYAQRPLVQALGARRGSLELRRIGTVVATLVILGGLWTWRRRRA